MDKDIDTFVSERKTGSERPAAIRYVNYYHPMQNTPEPGGKGGSGGKGEGGLPVREAPNKALPPIPTEESETNEPVGDDGQCVCVCVCVCVCERVCV